MTYHTQDFIVIELYGESFCITDSIANVYKLQLRHCGIN